MRSKPVRKRKLDPDESTMWLEHGVHLPSRALNMIGDINDEMLDRVVGGLQLLECQDSKEEIVVYLNTGGGDEVPGMAIYDLLKLTTCPVMIMVTGMAYSMGAIVLQAAAEGKRFMLPSSSLMLHTGEKAYEGHNENVRREMLFDKVMDEVCDRVILDRMRTKDPALNLGKLRDMLTLDTYIVPSEAIKLGLADAIVGGK